MSHTLEPIKIIDTIHHKNKYYTQVFHVVNRMPVFLYERVGDWLIGEDCGLFNFYYYEERGKNWEAFGGSKFTINMKNGDKIEAHGQWWDKIKPDYRDLLVNIGVASPEKLDRCYVFSGVWADPEILPNFVNISNNYYKYDKKHPDYQKHRIESRWEKS